MKGKRKLAPVHTGSSERVSRQALLMPNMLSGCMVGVVSSTRGAFEGVAGMQRKRLP